MKDPYLDCGSAKIALRTYGDSHVLVYEISPVDYFPTVAEGIEEGVYKLAGVLPLSVWNSWNPCWRRYEGSFPDRMEL